MQPSWQRRIFGPRPRRTALRTALVIVATGVTFTWILIPVRTQGISMLPTYGAGLHFVNRLAFVFHAPRRGDVVAIRFAGPHVLYIKRIVGLPGERIAIDDGTVRIDGRPIAEPYVHGRAPWMIPESRLGGDEYYVIGDNRSMPAIDQDFGRTTRGRIVGRVLF